MKNVMTSHKDLSLVHSTGKVFHFALSAPNVRMLFTVANADENGGSHSSYLLSNSISTQVARYNSFVEDASPTADSTTTLCLEEVGEALGCDTAKAFSHACIVP